jgi:SAM-dependent methyltransferase
MNVNKERVSAFGQELLTRYSDAMTVLFIDIGDRTGLLEAAAPGGSAVEIADRAGLAERPVREWLHGMVTAGVIEHDPQAASFRLPEEHAALLIGPTPYNLAPLARAASFSMARGPQLAEAFETGKGLPVDELHGGLTEVSDRLSRHRFDALLIDVYLPAAGEIVDRLRTSGGRVADVGCGTGHAANLLAQALPEAEVIGYDQYADGLELARAEAAHLDLDNIRFEVADARDVAADGAFDLITAFDVIHDLPDPSGTLTAIRNALTADGVFLMYDVGAPSDLAEQAGVPWAPLMYGLSLAYCVQNALAGDGEALGNMWGRERAEQLLLEAGFGQVDVTDPPLDPMNLLYACRR